MYMYMSVLNLSVDTGFEVFNTIVCCSNCTRLFSSFLNLIFLNVPFIHFRDLPESDSDTWKWWNLVTYLQNKNQFFNVTLQLFSPYEHRLPFRRTGENSMWILYLFMFYHENPIILFVCFFVSIVTKTNNWYV